ncbi:uncharacterized protein DCS_07923 [Drechmeria coniospora]|uniref:VPS37 C-terminal domain-containing protein n=1 Tax=Drechmeria coniospora TaxID=98403 RepID=A0A151GFT7_DRECN|nr:uncharacterized protein DCS_07923 [Drechmeria coniospora]KYK55958.1 uncharacterized protein DCS_07923 [Drechmeria coniospora]ODA76631.1 hypothetical protein RJ55_07902 [Drechmeria coniospora]
MESFPPGMAAFTPPAPPPKPGSHDTSGIGTPCGLPGPSGSPSPPGLTGLTGLAGPAPPPLPPPPAVGEGAGEPSTPFQQLDTGSSDPGVGWLPDLLLDMSTQDLAGLLASPSLLSALAHSPSTAHPCTAASHAQLTSALSQNSDFARQLQSLGGRLSHQRSDTQAHLLSTHSLERQWRQKQSDMDHALAPFSPASLYQRLSQGVQEQAGVCQAMEESFLEGGDGGDGGDLASEREVAEWVRRYREAKVQFYLRQERKERWDEGRVGGWR